MFKHLEARRASHCIFLIDQHSDIVTYLTLLFFLLRTPQKCMLTLAVWDFRGWERAQVWKWPVTFKDGR